MVDRGIGVEIGTRDGVTLGGRLFQPAVSSTGRRAAVVIAGALAVGQAYYAAFGRHLAERGFHALTFDYRGIGASRCSTTFRDARLREWGERDLEAVIDWLAREHPGSLLGVGHSLGGQMFGLAESSRRMDGLVTVAAQSGYWGHWPARLQVPMALLWYVALPGATRLFSRFPAERLGIGEDLPQGVALDFARWCRHPDYLVDARNQPLRSGFRAIEAPILAYSFCDDLAAPAPAVDALHRWFENASTARRCVQARELGLGSIGHFGFFRERFRTSLWAEAAEWLEKTGEASSRHR